MSAVIAQAAIVAKVVALLSASATLTGVPIQRNRLRAVPDSVSQVIVVRKTNSDAAGVPFLGHGTDWVTQIHVECYARGTSAQESHEAADALLLLAHAVMAANPTIDGLAMGTDPPRLGWDEEDLDAPLGVAIAQYPVLHRTASNALTAAA
jgi:hypothetical protein